MRSEFEWPLERRAAPSCDCTALPDRSPADASRNRRLITTRLSICMRVSNAADAPAGPCSLPPPGSPGTRPRNAGPPLGPRRLRTPPGKLRRDQGRAEDRGPAAAVRPRHPAAREDPAADAVRDRGPRGGDPRDRRAGPRPGQPPGAHPVPKAARSNGCTGTPAPPACSRASCACPAAPAIARFLITGAIRIPRIAHREATP